MSLTPEQAAAVTAVADAVTQAAEDDAPRHFLIEAVAGSGKTHALVEIARRVAAGRPEARIL